jgi:hypothetical protein
LVKKLYEAFGKGDIKTMIDHLADHLFWRFDAPSVIPVRWRFALWAKTKASSIGPENRCRCDPLSSCGTRSSAMPAIFLRPMMKAPL